MVRFSSAGNPVKPRKVVGTNSQFSMECDEYSVRMDVNFAGLSAKGHQRVVDWLEQAHAYIAYLRTDEFSYRKKQKEEAFDYKTKEGSRGNSSDWRKKAEQMKRRYTNADEFLTLLGLDEIPGTLEELNKARRATMRKAHPDMGGSEERAQAVNHAYEVIRAKI
jgi:hypothetical protein